MRLQAAARVRACSPDVPSRVAGGAPGGHPGGGGEAAEEDILATIAALERQTRFSTGGSEEAVAAGPSGVPPPMDEAAYQAMLSQVRLAGSLRAHTRTPCLQPSIDPSNNAV